MSNFFIPDPCHENWNQMTPKEQGRHCAVCSKVVVDFTKKQEPEINQILSTATGKVCGHFRVEQLNRDEQMKVFKQPSNLFNRNWKYFALATLGFFAFNKRSEAQRLKGKVALRGDVAPVQCSNTNTSVTSIYGSVQQTDGKPAGKAEVIVYSNGEEIARGTAIANGSYSIKIQPGKIVNQQVDIVVNYSHLATKHIYALPVPQPSNKLNIVLDEEIMLKGEIAFIPPPVIDTIIPVTDTAETFPVVDTVKTQPIPNNHPEKDTIILHSIPVIDTSAIKTENPVDLIEIPAENSSSDPHNTVWQQPETILRPEEIVSNIYPNPTASAVTVYCSKQDTYKVELYDEKGTLKMTKAFYGDRTDLDLSSFANGHYLVKLHTPEGQVKVMKVIKQH
jgi:hypothetical protein